MLLPVMKEVVKTLKTDNDLSSVLENLKQLPGGENLLKYIENFNENGKIEHPQAVEDNPLKFSK